MEVWFISALVGALFAGLGNFYFKIAAQRGYNPQLFSLYGAAISLLPVAVVLIFDPHPLFGYGATGFLALMSGVIIANTNIFKVKSLQFIDSTIYFPIFKILVPGMAIVAGVTLFHETFSKFEWLGMIVSMLVPLMLIGKAENNRQRNLTLGLVFLVISALTSAATAVINKYLIDESVPLGIVLLYAAVGILIGTIGSISIKVGWRNISTTLKEETSSGLIITSGVRSTLVTVSFGLTLYAFSTGGPLAVVHTINSLYILIPIVLAIIFYNEHWNLQKVIAIVLSVAALALLG